MSWCTWLPWPIGRHYCWFEMVGFFILGMALVINGFAIIVWSSRAYASVVGLAMVALGLGLAFVLATKETTDSR